MGLSDLETEAHKAVLALRELLARVDQTEKRLETVTAQFPERTEEVLAAGKSMVDAAVALEDVTETAQSELIQDAQQVETAYEQLRQAIAAIREQGTSAIDDGEEALARLAERLDEARDQIAPVVDSTVEACRQAIQSTKQAEETIAAAVAETEALLSQLSAALVQASSSVEEAGREALEQLEQKATSALDASEKQWSERVAQIKEVVDQAHESIRQHVSEAAARSLETLTALTDQALDTVEADVTTVQLDFNGLLSALEETRTHLEEAATAVAEGMTRAEQASRPVDERLMELRAHWATFGF